MIISYDGEKFSSGNISADSLQNYNQINCYPPTTENIQQIAGKALNYLKRFSPNIIGIQVTGHSANKGLVVSIQFKVEIKCE